MRRNDLVGPRGLVRSGLSDGEGLGGEEVPAPVKQLRLVLAHSQRDLSKGW